MLRFVFLTAWRNFIKQSSFSIINIAGLALGICCISAILLYVEDELSYDAFHEKGNRIYRVNSTTSFGGNQNRYSTTPAPLAEVIQINVPEAEQSGRLFGREATLQLMNQDSTIQIDRKYKEKNFYFIDPSLLNVLTIDFISGNKDTALDNPNQMIVSRRIAENYFGSVEEAIGKMVQVEGVIPLVVSAVIEDYPKQSSEVIEILSHFDNYFNIEAPVLRDYLRTDWLYSPVSTYVLLKEGADPDVVTLKIKEVSNVYADDRVKQNVSYSLQPISRIHLYSDFSFSGNVNAIRYVYIFLAVGGLILIIACINFINLSTVHSLKRAHEIGVRKIMGAEKRGLVYQFLGESTGYVLISFGIAILILYFLLPGISSMVGKDLVISSLLRGELLVALGVVFIVTSLSAGLYPALFVSGFNAIHALRNDARGSGASMVVRRVLVVTQFSSSIVLIVFALTIYAQMKFMATRPLGFQKDFVVTVPIFSDNFNSILGGGVDGALRARMNAFENELLQNSGIEAVTVSSVLPGSGAVSALVQTDKVKEGDNIFIPVTSVDYDFLNTYKIELIAGRDFSKQTGTDHLQAFIINEEACKLLRWNEPEKAIGENIEALGKKATVIGVTRNYHFESLQQSLRPLLVEVDVSRFGIFSIRINNQHVTESVEKVRTIWNKMFPERVFEYSFLDDRLMESYRNERRFGKMVTWFSALAILISSLGIFGLSAYINHQKQREASIRKILGATVSQVFLTLSGEFIKILVIAAVIAIPAGYWLTSEWLRGFPYHVSVGWMAFVIACAGTTLVVFLTTFYQTLKTAALNPVNTLRSE